uniref:Uncharacterized protein n=1 Tax=Lotharella globosa TaxID=91324 RepID=A0A6V3U764_9EUKA|mmetsp:Transcript_39137/g.75123  ORF Transcript_39137/g.75123 Transcript_39137/m.75123 type:complete len:123 (+) Transcript_39137:58-426(+)
MALLWSIINLASWIGVLVSSKGQAFSPSSQPTVVKQPEIWVFVVGDYGENCSVYKDFPLTLDPITKIEDCQKAAATLEIRFSGVESDADAKSCAYHRQSSMSHLRLVHIGLVATNIRIPFCT